MKMSTARRANPRPWRNEYKNRFLTFAAHAKGVSAIQARFVAYESSFSDASNISAVHRGSLGDNKV